MNTKHAKAPALYQGTLIDQFDQLVQESRELKQRHHDLILQMRRIRASRSLPAQREVFDA